MSKGTRSAIVSIAEIVSSMLLLQNWLVKELNFRAIKGRLRRICFVRTDRTVGKSPLNSLFKEENQLGPHKDLHITHKFMNSTPVCFIQSRAAAPDCRRESSSAMPDRRR